MLWIWTNNLVSVHFLEKGKWEVLKLSAIILGTRTRIKSSFSRTVTK